MLDLRRIRVLTAVAQHGSFSAAAAAVGYTQPAVSRQVAVLEQEVGTQLVRRTPAGAVLTEAGRLLVAHGEQALRSLDHAEAELRALAGLEGGTLRLGTFASAAASIVPIAVARYRARHPAVELQIEMADPPVSVPALRAGRLDLALSHDPAGWPDAAAAPGDAPAFELVPLFEDPVQVAMPADHPLAGRAEIELSALCEAPWMLATSHTCPDSRLLRRACAAAGFTPQIAFENDDYSAILGFVAAGVGLALIPDMVSRGGVRDDVVLRPLTGPVPTRPIGAIVPPGRRQPATAAMLDVLREVSEEWVAGRRDGVRRSVASAA